MFICQTFGVNIFSSYCEMFGIAGHQVCQQLGQQCCQLHTYERLSWSHLHFLSAATCERKKLRFLGGEYSQCELDIIWTWILTKTFHAVTWGVKSLFRFITVGKEVRIENDIRGLSSWSWSWSTSRVSDLWTCQPWHVFVSPLNLSQNLNIYLHRIICF